MIDSNKFLASMDTIFEEIRIGVAAKRNAVSNLKITADAAVASRDGISNTAASQAELEALKKKLGELNALAAQADVNAKDYRVKYDDGCKKSVELEDKKNALYTKGDGLRTDIVNLNADKSRLTSQRELLGKSIDWCNGEVESLKRSIDKKVKEMEAQKKKASTWGWVPGYGQYLLASYLINIDNDKKTLNRRLSELKNNENERAQLLSKLNNTVSLLTQKQKELEKIQSEIKAIEDQIEPVIKTISEINSQLVYWEDQYIYCNMLIDSLKSEILGIESKIDVLDLIKLSPKLIEAEV